MKESTQSSQSNAGNHGGGVFTFGRNKAHELKNASKLPRAEEPKVNHKNEKLRLSILVLFTILALRGEAGIPATNDISPSWARNLVVYEIATKAFTSPNGPESGTFNSLREKLPYLENLGVNGIWLTGHSWSDSKHFYGIWTQYACIRPDQLDPTLGTEADFKALIDEAHRRGIRVFLDSIEHGVMTNSPLVREHPDWFKGGSWGMVDYDWHGTHPDLEKFWVDLWLQYILKFGVDGVRCDCGVFRQDLWIKIKQQAAEKGHPILVFGERPDEEAASDFIQKEHTLSNQKSGLLSDHPALNDQASFSSNEKSKWDKTRLRSVQLSCHDEGWEGFPPSKNPYMALGSRYIFGYGLILTPHIPIFMSGEEFGANYVSLPNLTPDLYGKGKPGTGRWLYGSWLHWDQLGESEHLQMLADVTKLLRIRRENSDLIHAWGKGDCGNILAVPYAADRKLPVPYIIWNKTRAIVVAANPDQNKLINIELKLPLAKMGWMGVSRFKVVDLWSDDVAEDVKVAQLLSMKKVIKPDKSAGGGIAVFLIEPANYGN